MDTNKYFIGQRVLLDGVHLGTVKFFGKVESQPVNEDWIGIEWDDSSRGKHSGRFKDGPVLFETSIPNAATFMKPSSRLEIGRSFISALKEKYLDENLMNPNDENSMEKNEDKNMRKIALKFNQLDNLRLIGLESSKINGPGDQSELSALNGLLSSLETLNLSSNLFSNMGDISLIAGKLPRLKTLILSSNRFHLIPKTLPGLRGVHVLYLDSTLLSWQQGIDVGCQIEALSELSLSNCRIGCLWIQNSTGHVPLIESLSVLTLDRNDLTDWTDLISGLKPFPRLQQLNLRRNRLRITPRNDETTICQSLGNLSLTGNLIELGSEIDYLRDWFPSTISLFLDGNPLYDVQDPRKSRLLALARFPTLAHLDGSQITSAERVEADLFYWLTIKKEATDSTQLIKSHTRYLELLEKFGPPEIEPKNWRSSSLKAKMIKLSIIWPNHLQIENNQYIQVLPSMTGRGLKIYLSKIIRRSGCKSSQNLNELVDHLELHTVNSDTGLNRLICFENNNKPLEWYGITDNDTLQVLLKE